MVPEEMPVAHVGVARAVSISENTAFVGRAASQKPFAMTLPEHTKIETM